MSTAPSALRITERFAIGMENPLRGLSSTGTAATRKGSAARTRAGEKYISARSNLAGDADSKDAETGDNEGSTMLPFYTREGMLYPKDTSGFRGVGSTSTV